MNPGNGAACRSVVILGAGGTGLYMAHCLGVSGHFRFVGFLDDDPDKRMRGYEQLPVLGGLAEWSQLDSDWLFLSSLYGAKRMHVFRGVVDSLDIPPARWATFAAPQSVVLPGVELGPGSFVGPGCVIEPGAVLGARCALLGNVYVAHQSRLGEYVACANSVSIAGGVQIGHTTFVGANSTIREYMSIGSGAVVGMGAVVTKPVPDGATVAGNPARPLPKR